MNAEETLSRGRQSSAITAPEEGIFLAGAAQYNKPARIATRGHYYPRSEINAAKALLNAPRNAAPASGANYAAIRQNLGWTKLIEALNNERHWPIKRLFALLEGISRK